MAMCFSHVSYLYLGTLKQMLYPMNLKVKVGERKFAKIFIPVDRSVSCDINNANDQEC